MSTPTASVINRNTGHMPARHGQEGNTSQGKKFGGVEPNIAYSCECIQQSAKIKRSFKIKKRKQKHVPKYRGSTRQLKKRYKILIPNSNDNIECTS